MRKSRPSKVDKKALIVNTAISCFIKNGVAQTRMAEIAQEAKIDHPLIHYYFAEMDELYLEVINVVLNSLKQISVEPASMHAHDPKRALLVYVRSYFTWTKKNPGLFSIWNYFYYLATYNPKFSELNRMIRETGRNRIATFIYQGIEAGHFKLPKNRTVSQTALVIQGLITGNTIMAYTEGSDVDSKLFADATENAVMDLLSH